MNILLKPFPETSPKIPALRWRTQHSHSPSGEQPAPFPFPSSSSTSFPTGWCLLTSKAMGSWQLVPGWSPEPVPKGPSSLTSQWAQAAQLRLSCCCFYAKAFPVSLTAALINASSESPGLVLWNLSYTKSVTHILQLALGQTSSGPGPSLVTVPNRSHRAEEHSNWA